MQHIIDADKSDLFDVLAYVAYALPPKTREARARQAHVSITTEFSNNQQAFLHFVLDQYVEEGVDELDPEKLTPLLKLKYNALEDAMKQLGDAALIRLIFVGFQKYLYQTTSSAGQ